MTQETKLTRHRAKQKKAGITRFSVQLDNESVSLLRLLCQKHGKTQGELIGMAIKAADALLAGRLQVARAAAQPPARVIIRPTPQERPQPLEQVACITNTPPPPQNTPIAPQCEPAQAGDDADARIRAAAFVVEQP